MSFRAVGLAMLLMALAWFQFGQESSAAALGQKSADLLDPRPPRSILIVGNSRTSTNNMPRMLRRIADSAGSPTKFQVETSTRGAYTFKRHYNDPRTRRLLAAEWDDVILQAESGAQIYPLWNANFLKYGAKLAGVTNPNARHPRLLVGWAYDPGLYTDPSYNTVGYTRSNHLALINSEHRKLARNAGLSLIDLSGLWESVRKSHPSIRLTSDGNHPTSAGTYLYALGVYSTLSNSPVAAVTYTPEGLPERHARALRQAVDAWKKVSAD